jgi:hypothetical protein
MPTLVQLVKERKPALVVIGPLFRLVRIRDEKAYAETYAATGPLIDITRATATHILLTHHAGKGLKTDAIDAPLGSTALGGIVSTLLLLKRTEQYRTLQSVQRIGSDLPETVLTFDAGSRTLSLGGSKADTEQAEAETRILDYLEHAGEPKTQEQIREEVEGRTQMLRAGLTAVVRAGKVQKIGKGVTGNPYLYERWFSGSQNGLEPRVIIGEIVVPENSQKSILVPGNLQARKCENGGVPGRIDEPTQTGRYGLNGVV